MTIAARRTWLALGMVALVQSAVLASMVWDRVTLLRKGQEVVAEVIPVDPRSLFRGDYVIMTYPFNIVPSSMLGAEERPWAGRTIYVGLVREGEIWKVGAAAWDRASLAGHTGGPVLKGHTERRWRGFWLGRSPDISVRYGIESYFVPEGKGLELEKLVREKRLAAILAVDAGGNVAIKGLQIDGKRVYDEPLF